MAHAQGPDFQGGHGDPLTQRTFPLFFDVLGLLIGAGVTVVAEAAFQDGLWRPGLEPLAELAQLRIVRCQVSTAVSFERAVARSAGGDSHLRAHGDSTIGKGVADWARAVESFEYPTLPALSIDVDTTDGYDPNLEQIVDFINRP
jgi:predicted kinase